MNRADTAELLRLRRQLTQDSFSEDTVDAWHAVLERWTLDQCRAALVTAARIEKRLTVGHIAERLPHERPSTEQVYPWDGPTDRGRTMAAQIHAHIRGEHTEERSHRCPTCRFARPELGAEPQQEELAL